MMTETLIGALALLLIALSLASVAALAVSNHDALLLFGALAALGVTMYREDV